MAFFKASKRKSSIPVGRNGIPARAIYSSSGQTVPIDGITSLDGIPIGIEGRREVAKQVQRGRGRIMKIKYFLYERFFATGWVIVCLTVGAHWQGWF